MPDEEHPRLLCGGRGPCCHLGYAHRHCEHCDVPITLYASYVVPWYQQPWYAGPPYPRYYNNGGLGLSGQLSNFSQLNGLQNSLQSPLVPIDTDHEHEHH